MSFIQALMIFDASTSMHQRWNEGTEGRSPGGGTEGDGDQNQPQALGKARDPFSLPSRYIAHINS